MILDWFFRWHYSLSCGSGTRCSSAKQRLSLRVNYTPDVDSNKKRIEMECKELHHGLPVSRSIKHFRANIVRRPFSRPRQGNCIQMKNRFLWQNLHIVMQLGLTVAGSVVFCFIVGRYIDQLLGLRGIFTTLFILFGVVGGAVVAYRQIQTVLADDRKPGDEGKDE
jgi:hypothetical protein